MFFLRRSLLGPLLFSLLFVGGLGFVLAYLGLEELAWPRWQILALGFGLSCLLSFSVFYFQVLRPLNKVIREFKALLTGKPYRKIYTTKVNELGILAHFFNEVTRSLEQISSDVRTHRRIQKELSSAQEIQAMLIPKNAPSIPELEITAKTRPASEMGGDTFDFYKKENRYLFYVGDSTGHGIPAGIVMVMVDVLLETFILSETVLIEMVGKLNQFIKPHLKPSMFMTLALLEWLPDSNQLKWVGAGHEHLLHVKTKERKVKAIKVGGLAVGMVPDNRPFLKEQVVELEENDFVILYSDGIVEAKNVNGENYGLKRLMTYLESRVSPESGTDSIFEQIAIDVGRFMEGHAQLDDMTLIVLKHRKDPTQAVEKSTDW